MAAKLTDKGHGITASLIIHGAAAILAALVFVVDMVTPADNVSVCFAYLGPVLLSFFQRRPVSFVYALAGSILSVAGSVAQPVGQDISLIFVANRIIAVLVLWTVGALVYYRLKAEETLTERLERERLIAQQQRNFIAIVSHEFRTPMTTIDGQAYRLIKLHETIQPEDILNRARKIRSAVQRMIGTIDGILFSVRLGDGDIRISPSAVDLRSLLDTLCQQQRDLTPDHPITCRCQDLPATIMADATLLGHVFSNLLSNAAKYSAEGRPIEVEGKTVRAMAVVTVRDHGIGIPAEDLPNLFHRYYRGSNAMGVPGTGIGLYLVRKLVEMHEGTVTVESIPGQDSVFTVMLPIMPADVAHLPASAR